MITAMTPARKSTRQASNAVAKPADNERIDKPEAVTQVLRQFIDGDLPLTLSAPDGTVLSTSLWAEERGRGLVVFSIAGDVESAESLVQCNEAVAFGYIDSARVQFEVRGLVLVHGFEACALNAEYPQEILRFQRRDAYRVRPLEHSQPMLHVNHPLVPDALLLMRVTDISHGGIALISPNAPGAFRLGQTLPDAVLELDPQTQVSLGLRVVRIDDARGYGGQDGQIRLGCEMIDLRGEEARQLQRYIDHTQRRRRMLALR